MTDSEIRREKDKDCQLQVLYDSAEGMTIRNRSRNFALRLLSAVQRRVMRLRGKLGQPDEGLFANTAAVQVSTSDEVREGDRAGDGGAIKPGDVVEVLSKEEIKATLDDNNVCEGLQFMPGMEAFYGRRLRVRRRVATIFDERAWRMVRIKKTYILDGAICEGKGLYDKEGCDRCCFFFWKEKWLKKV